jgi:hypothetical protein
VTVRSRASGATDLSPTINGDLPRKETTVSEYESSEEMPATEEELEPAAPSADMGANQPSPVAGDDDDWDD